ncbi:toll/interleukin-1 receptor domain-containing protein [Terrabacter sp. NPDC000476]|uniref:toll/interleukin-1 receptor domain-containing protein n=1 Tax=Terrabacter sp. NPDC000476 TaxID=3154258 RepID=UPI00332F98D3
MVDPVVPPARVFISYRREETAYPAAWLYDRLVDRYGGHVFKDVDSIRLGDDFVEVITRAVGSCQVLLALIGHRWLTVTDQDGRRRLDDPDDFVRLEVEAALARDVRVIPILVEGASLPRPEELPPSLAGLVRRQALELSPARFDFDTGRLFKVLDTTLDELRATPSDGGAEQAQMTSAQQEPRESPEPHHRSVATSLIESTQHRRRRRRRRPLAYAVAVALLVAAAATAATLALLDRSGAPDTGGRRGNELVATAAWRLVVSNSSAVDNRGCTITVTNTDSGARRTFENVWGTKTFQMQSTGTFRWESDDPACRAVDLLESGRSVLPFSHKAGTGDTDVFMAPRGGTVTVQVLAFNNYRECRFELHDAADGELVDLGRVTPASSLLRLESSGRPRVYLSDFAGCDVRVSGDAVPS